MNSSTTGNSYGEGGEIYSPFSRVKKVHFIESGYVTASTIDDTGKHRIHLIYGPGSYFPILSVYRGTDQRATYDALTDVSLAVMSAHDFLEKLSADGVFCREILQKTVDQLALFADRVIDLQLTKLTDQLLLKLQILAKDHGKKVGSMWQLPYRLRHHQVADMLGVERESVTRGLKQLEESGKILTTKSGFLKIVI